MRCQRKYSIEHEPPQGGRASALNKKKVWKRHSLHLFDESEACQEKIAVHLEQFIRFDDVILANNMLDANACAIFFVSCMEQKIRLFRNRKANSHGSCSLEYFSDRKT